jgi:hypothetical protein
MRMYMYIKTRTKMMEGREKPGTVGTLEKRLLTIANLPPSRLFPRAPSKGIVGVYGGIVWVAARGDPGAFCSEVEEEGGGELVGGREPEEEEEEEDVEVEEGCLGREEEGLEALYLVISAVASPAHCWNDSFVSLIVCVSILLLNQVFFMK